MPKLSQTFARTATVMLLALTLLPTASLAASDGAWEEMRADVSAKCLAAVAGSIDNPKAAVDPFGSNRFGLALVSGKPTGADGIVRYICVYDKQTKAAEIGSEMTGEMLGIAE